MNIYLFDIDGTIINSDDRLIFLKTEPKNYQAFESESVKDPGIQPVINVLRALRKSENKIFIVTARSERAKEATVNWLKHNDVQYDEIFMKAINDSRSDDAVKFDLLMEIRKKHGEPTAVFDDRRHVNKMWVSQGVFVFDVSQLQER